MMFIAFLIVLCFQRGNGEGYDEYSDVLTNRLSTTPWGNFHLHTDANNSCGGTCAPKNTSYDFPNGDFRSSCYNCSQDYHVLICTCRRKSNPVQQPLLRNISGEWTSAGNFTGAVDTFMLAPENSTVKTAISYSALCTDGGRYDQVTCSPKPVPPVPNWQEWKFWNIASVNVTSNGTTASMRLDNGSTLLGKVAVDSNSILWTYTNATNMSNILWVRRPIGDSGVRTSMSLKSCRKVPDTNGVPHFNVSNEDGYLTCDWTLVAPPRVGPYVHSLNGNKAIKHNCRVIETYTFFAPQFKNRGDPVFVTDLGETPIEKQKLACCEACHQQRKFGGGMCKGWTISNFGTENAVCSLSAKVNTAYPTSDDSTVSGYLISSDPATFCEAKFESNNGFWGDKYMAEGISVAQLSPRNDSQFPTWWRDKKKGRGISWLFYPAINESDVEGHCYVNAPQVTVCIGPEMNGTRLTSAVRGKPWIVFIHGGAFQSYDGKDANYAQTASKVATAAGMGVLAPDYRSLARRPTPATNTQQIEDCISALLWLQRNGAAPIYLYGDSSGGTQVYQTLLTIAKNRDVAKKNRFPDPYPDLVITRAATFSAWLDLSSSFPQYDSRQSCGGKCQDISSTAFVGSSGGVRMGSMCQAKRYTAYQKTLPVDDPTISPIDAPDELLAQLPPIMLVVGAGEVLLGENIAFAQRCQMAGVPTQVQVFTGMWHDFIQETEGCGSKPMAEAVTAINRVGSFFANNESCQVVCKNMVCSGAAPVKWNFNYHELPPTTAADCQGARGP